MTDYLARAAERLEYAANSSGADDIAIARAYIDLYWAAKDNKVVSVPPISTVIESPAPAPESVDPAGSTDAPAVVATPAPTAVDAVPVSGVQIAAPSAVISPVVDGTPAAVVI